MDPKQSHGLSERMASAARELQAQGDPHDTMDAAVRLAVDNVPHCDAAAISLIHKSRKVDRVDTPAYTSKDALRADQLQYEIGEGPCLSAIDHEPVIHSKRLAEDDRWPTWAARVEHETGLRSGLCFRLFTHESTVGALNLYSKRESAWDREDREDGLAIAAHVAVAVAAAQRASTAEGGLHSRSTIGQAMGIVMERFDMGPDQALALLTRLSQNANVKVRDLAAEIVDTRRMPG